MHPALRYYTYYRGGGALPDTPLYDTLDNFIAIYDSTGLVAGENNDYGQVDSSNNISTAGWKSLAPGPTGVDMLPVDVFGSNNITIQMAGSAPVVEFNGFSRLRNTAGTTEFNPLHYNATFANLQWEQYILFRPGFGPTPGQRIGIYGNNAAGTSTNKGVNGAYDNREMSSRTHAMINNITRGQSGSFVSTQTDNDIFTPNTWQLLTLRFDGSLTAANRLKAWINGESVSITVTSASTAVVTGPTYDFELGAEGNGLFPMRGQMSHVVIRTGLTEDSVRETFETSLQAWATYFNAASDVSDRLRVFNIHDQNLYTLSTHLCQSPLNSNVFINTYTVGTAHTANEGRKSVYRKSTTGVINLGAQTDYFDPADPSSVRDQQSGFTSTGRFLSVITHGETTMSLMLKISDDNAGSFSDVDLSSLIPSDGLGSYRVYGGGIKENNGRVGFGLYKFTAEGDVTQSANYFFYSDDDGDNWSVSTIRAVASAYINESDWIGIDNDNAIFIIRNDDTHVWSLYSSSNNGTSWTSVGAITFGESWTQECPGALRKFDLDGTPVVAFYYCDRNNNNGPFKAVYTTVARLLVDPLDFDLDTKTTLVNAFLHYGGIVHYDNDMKAVASFNKEPAGMSFTGENEIWNFFMPTNHKAAVKTALGI